MRDFSFALSQLSGFSGPWFVVPFSATVLLLVAAGGEVVVDLSGQRPELAGDSPP
jgi:hypothetical protein